MSLTLAEHLGWSSNGWILPKLSFQYTTISSLFKFRQECISISRYSAAGLYTTMGLYWLFPSTAREKSEMAFSKFELFPFCVKLFLLLPASLGNEVCVGWMGRRAEVKTMDATGFHRAILDISCETFAIFCYNWRLYDSSYIIFSHVRYSLLEQTGSTLCNIKFVVEVPALCHICVWETNK